MHCKYCTTFKKKVQKIQKIQNVQNVQKVQNVQNVQKVLLDPGGLGCQGCPVGLVLDYSAKWYTLQIVQLILSKRQKKYKIPTVLSLLQASMTFQFIKIDRKHLVCALKKFFTKKNSQNIFEKDGKNFKNVISIS